MPIINFENHVVEIIESGEKRQTIRIERKYPIRSSDKLYLYSGLRTKNCVKLKTPFDQIGNDGRTFVKCKKTDVIWITSEYRYRNIHSYLRKWDIFGGDIYINGIPLENEKYKDFVIAEGFHPPNDAQSIIKSISDFFEYFWKRFGTNFRGQLITW